MSKHKMHRKSTNIDMTAMCDVAFLLLTFFMLATKFKPPEPVEVTTPNSVSSKQLPEKDVILITIDKKGRVFLEMDNPVFRKQVIENLNETRELGLTATDIKNFQNSPAVGVPFGQLKNLLRLSADEVNSVYQPGIPVDSANNELIYWIRDVLVVYAGRQLNMMIKGDNATKFPAFKQVIEAFKKNDQNKFQLVTTPEDIPKGTPLYVTHHRK